jgi:hypothetical protein
MALASLGAISGPKKISILRAHPFQWPASNHYVPRLINNRYIINYFKLEKSAQLTIVPFAPSNLSHGFEKEKNDEHLSNVSFC